MPASLEKLCLEKGLKLTPKQRTIARALDHMSQDHPSVEEVYAQVIEQDKNIGIATVYRALKHLEEHDIIEKHDFGDGRARYEAVSEEHHDHMIDVKSGKVIEFISEEIERLQEEIAHAHGYKLVDHRLELYVVPLDE